MRRNLFWLSDEQWKRIEPHLPTDVRGIERADDRRVISGIVQVLKSGCRWCDCWEWTIEKHADDRLYAHQSPPLGRRW
jgi:transposase